jgi:hypothetical protein
MSRRIVRSKAVRFWLKTIRCRVSRVLPRRDHRVLRPRRLARIPRTPRQHGIQTTGTTTPDSRWTVGLRAKPMGRRRIGNRTTIRTTRYRLRADRECLTRRPAVRRQARASSVGPRCTKTQARSNRRPREMLAEVACGRGGSRAKMLESVP